jgi:RHS repeat-associated protein
VLERSEFEPYGKLLNRPLEDGPGYTGHVSDAATGLSYMQQRYYDPQIGRFLSVDPVTALSNPVGAFNRYWYANNNPYKFTDPDGRQVARIENGEIRGKNTKVDLKPVVARPARSSTDAIVIHRTVSSTAGSAITSAVATGGKASFHIVIGKDGATTQIANLNNVANHVGRPTGDVSNQNSIGIEVVGNYDSATKSWDPLTPAQVESTAQAINVIAKEYGVSLGNVFPHESVSRKTAGEGGVVMQATQDRLYQISSPFPPSVDSSLQGYQP